MIAPLLGLMLATATPAQPPAGQPQGMAAVASVLTKEGFSAAGLKILQARPEGLDARMAAFRARSAAIGQELAAAKAADDVERFGAAMRASDALNAEARQMSTDQLIRMLGALGPADRKIFMRHVGLPGQAPPAGR